MDVEGSRARAGRFVRAGALVVGLFLGVVGAVACTPKRQVRTDLAPLSKRLDLPAGVHEVRWVAVDANEAGCDSFATIPEPDASHEVYAAIALDAAAWASLEGRLGFRSSPGALVLPGDIAAAILPAALLARLESGRQVSVPGRSLDVGRLARAKGVALVRALRAGDELLVELRLSRSS